MEHHRHHPRLEAVRIVLDVARSVVLVGDFRLQQIEGSAQAFEVVVGPLGAVAEIEGYFATSLGFQDPRQQLQHRRRHQQHRKGFLHRCVTLRRDHHQLEQQLQID